MTALIKPRASGWRLRKETANEHLNAQEVARLAYELYEQRGRADGHDFEDWLNAEAIVKQRRGVAES